MTALLWLACSLAALPFALALWNVWLYRPPPTAHARQTLPRVSVLIPARNEERNIGAALDAVVASTHRRIEVLVLDDGSTDATAAIVRTRAARDARVRLIVGPPLPAGWCGKPFACAELARQAAGELLLFVDADVRLAPDAVERLATAVVDGRASLVSGVPRQLAGSFGERLLVPLIHFVLLAYLPLAGMRWCRRPAFGAACGQAVIVERDAYRRSGGHAAVAASSHDGLTLARRFRAAGFATDLVDLTAVATCRMYEDSRAALHGFAKNAHEGLGSPRGVVPWSLLLLGGQTLPALTLPFAAGHDLLLPAALGTAFGYGTRALLAWRFVQSWRSALLHPLGVLVLVAIQWYALGRRRVGRPVSWKGRVPLQVR